LGVSEGIKGGFGSRVLYAIPTHDFVLIEKKKIENLDRRCIINLFTICDLSSREREYVFVSSCLFLSGKL
jgi:hypothetical protein